MPSPKSTKSSVPATPTALMSPTVINPPPNHLQRYSTEYNSVTAPNSHMKYKQDTNGNTIVTLESIGLQNAIRFHRFEDLPRFSELDVAVAVTGLNSDNAGTLYFAYIEVR